MFNKAFTGEQPATKRQSLLLARLRGFRRVYSPLNMLLLIGRFLQKRAIRTLSLVAVAVWTVLYKSYDNLVALSASAAGARLLEMVLPHIGSIALTVGLLFPLGLLLIFIHNAVAVNFERRARINNLLLAGDLKKAVLIVPYLEQLWEEVYSSERNVNPAMVVRNKVEFVTLAHSAILKPEPQTIQELRVGFPLLVAESWARRGLFTVEDHIGDLVEFHQTLRDLRWLRYAAWQRELLNLVRGDPQPAFWHSFTIRKFMLLIGGCLQRLNQRNIDEYGRFVRAEHFIWPSEELDTALAEQFGEQLLTDLQAERRRIFRLVFGNDWATARLQVFWMFCHDYKTTLRLRLEFDPWFVMRGGVEAELRGLELEFGKRLVKKREFAKRYASAKNSRHTCAEWLTQGWLKSEDRLFRRIVWVALHANLFGAGQLDVNDESACKLWLGELRQHVPRLNRGLRKAREIHVLARHQFDVYSLIVWQLGEYATTEELAPAQPASNGV